MHKANKKTKDYKYSLFKGRILKSIDGSVEMLEPSDITYIGRGEYWVKKRGIACLLEVTE